MIKIIAIAAGVGLGAWYYVSGSRINEQQVHAFYEKASHAFYARDPEAMCKLHSAQFTGHERVTAMGVSQETTVSRDQACESAQASFQMFEKIGSQMGGMLTIEYHYRIDDITLTNGRKRARVTGNRLIKMGETVMQFDTDFTEEIEREWGQARLVRSNTSTRMRVAGGQAMGQSGFFK
jgi:hypothetical protein